jgi:invasion protein IalB
MAFVFARRNDRFLLALCLASLFGVAAGKMACAAEQQKPPEPQAPVSSTPDSTTETFGDWSLICNAIANSSVRICEVDATIVVRGQNSPIARVAFARPQKDKPLRLIVQTPNNVLIAPGVKVETESGKDTVALSFRACTPTGCFAESDVTADQLKSFRGRATPGRIVLTDATGKAFALEISLRGLDQALDSLAKRG